MDGERFDHVVLGAGLRGLAAALQFRRDHPSATLLVIDAAPRAGGQVQTQRSNGFTCELGPFAFTADEVAPLLAAMAPAPPIVSALATARTGSRFDGTGLVPVAIDPAPVSFGTGCEELVQAGRRILAPSMRLGRAAVGLRPLDVGFAVELGGEAGSRLTAARLTAALPLRAAAALLAGFDRELAPLAQRLHDDARAFVFLGGHGADAPELRGYGIAPTADLDTPVAEAIFCTQVFARRALPGRFLVRVELAVTDPDAADADLVRVAEDELRRWTGTRASFGFTKVHRFWSPAAAAGPAAAECRSRLAAVARHVGALSLC